MANTLSPLNANDSPRQRQFVEELRSRGAKTVQSTYDRVGQNHKELTVSRGEYLEVRAACEMRKHHCDVQVLNDTKNWWECRNVQNRIGYVPHTILTVIGTGTTPPTTSNGNNGNARYEVYMQIVCDTECGSFTE